MNPFPRPLTLFLAFFLFACSSHSPKENIAADSASNTSGDTMEALLISKGGSALRGHVIVAQKDDRFVLTVDVYGGTPGGRYQLAFFDNGNCSSPNAFSAGKPWQLPDTDTDAATRIPHIYIDAAGSGSLIVRSLPNPQKRAISVFKNKSALIFDGEAAPLLPNVPNDVIACGVFEIPKSFFD